MLMLMAMLLAVDPGFANDDVRLFAISPLGGPNQQILLLPFTGLPRGGRQVFPLGSKIFSLFYKLNQELIEPFFD